VANSAEDSPPEPPPPALPPATSALLANVEGALDGYRDGLSLAELRASLGLPMKDLRLAIDAGLRVRALRRTGSHNTLRYLSNRHP
jgi:hypothetical protein